jgi:hypothetical protein
MRKQLTADFQTELVPLVPAETALVIVPMVADLLARYEDEITDAIELRYREWEARMGDDDTTLYTLGLRHASDIVQGKEVGA